jgi:PAS domain S-box-containing protein
MTSEELTYPDDRAQEAELGQKMLRGEQDSYELEKRFLRRDGSPLWVAVTSSAARATGGAVLYRISIIQDISDRKWAEEHFAPFADQMRAAQPEQFAELRFRQFFAALPQYCHMTSPEGNLLDVNPAACEALGYSKKELIGKSLFILFTPESHSKVADLFNKWKKTGKLRDEEVVILTKQGEKRTMLLSAGSIFDVEGKLLHSASVMVDITERKQLEQSLLWRLEFEYLLSDLSRRFIGLPENEVDANMEQGLARLGKFLELDRITLFEFSADRTKLSPTYAWNSPEVRKAPLFVTMKDLPWWNGRVLRGKVSHASRLNDLPEEAHAEKEYLRQRGIVSVASIPLEVGGQTNGAILFVSERRQVLWAEDLVSQLRVVGDIFWNALKRKRATEALLASKAIARESEERFRQAAHFGKMFAYEWDADTDVFKVLGEIPQSFGIEKEEYSTGKLMLAKMHPDDRQRLMAEIAGISPEKPQFQIRIRLTRSDGTLIWVEKNGYWIFNEQGRLLRIVGMVIDITESKQSEEIVASVGGRLIEAQEEERRRIARELHDDVSQKLGMLAIGLQEIAMTFPESQTQLRMRIDSLLQRTSEMSNDVHALSHRLHTSRLDLVGLVGTMSSFCCELADQRKVEIDFTHRDVPTFLPSQVSLCLYRILQEGLGNAVKHSGVRHFEVRLERAADALQLTISDSGVGFDSSTAMDFKGLGLISMRERVNLMKGTLSIESKPGGGTQIQVCVPIAFGTDTN